MSQSQETIQREDVPSPEFVVVEPSLSPSCTPAEAIPEAAASPVPSDIVPTSSPSPALQKVLSPTPSQYQVLLLEQLHDRELLLQVIQRQEALQKTMDEILRRSEATARPQPKVINLFLTEKEAAEMAGISPKTLADRRRAGRVPRDLYRQDDRKGKVKYNASKWRQHIGVED